MLTNVEAKFTVYILNEKIILKFFLTIFQFLFKVNFLDHLKKKLHLLNTFINIFQMVDAWDPSIRLKNFGFIALKEKRTCTNTKFEYQFRSKRKAFSQNRRM